MGRFNRLDLPAVTEVSLFGLCKIGSSILHLAACPHDVRACLTIVKRSLLSSLYSPRVSGDRFRTPACRPTLLWSRLLPWNSLPVRHRHPSLTSHRTRCSWVSPCPRKQRIAKPVHGGFALCSMNRLRFDSPSSTQSGHDRFPLALFLSPDFCIICARAVPPARPALPEDPHATPP